MGFPYVFPIYFGGTPSDVAVADTVQLSATVARLAQFLRGTFDAKPNVKGILGAFVQESTAVQIGLESIANGRQDPLSVGGEVLDALGSIVGQPRQGLSDAVYWTFIQARIKANNSSGRTEDLYGIFALVIPMGVTMSITTRPPANFLLYLTGAITAELAGAFQNLLHNARAAGVDGILDYGLHPTNQTFGFDGVSPGFDQGHFRGELT